LKGENKMRDIKFKFYFEDDLPQIHSVEDLLGDIDIDGYIDRVEFTGLFDKRGAELFEGDICKNEIGEFFTVVFSNGCFFIHPSWKNDDVYDLAIYMLKSMPTVVGNIY